MRELIAFITLHLLPPVAVFTAWNEYRKRHTQMLFVAIAGSTVAGCGLLLDSPKVGLVGLVVLVPPVLTMCRDFRSEDK